ncbi:CRISPR-associated helicase Cas3' [Deinococcota bacterium DY0809b]
MEPWIFWAKSGNDTHPEGHPLLAHMLDAAAVARAILLREPPSTRQTLANALGLSEDEALNFASFTVGLHDLGKASADFQRKWPAGMKRLEAAGFGYDPAGLLGVAHGPIGEHLTLKVLPQLGFSNNLSRKLARLLGAHHGFLATGGEVKSARDTIKAENGPWDEARLALVKSLWDALGTPLTRSRTLSTEAALWLMGLTSFADWLASSPEFFPYGRDLRDPRAYLTNALSLAIRALDSDRVKWWSRTPLAPVPPTFKKVFPFSPNGLQSKVIEGLHNLDGPSLLIIEAPMGGGKTEAALYAHLLLQAKNGHRGLYVAMPTQATGNAMFARVDGFLRTFGDRPHDLQLVHGAALLNPDYLKLREVGGVVGGESDQAVLASEWFSAKKRAMLTEYGVGTVDQALLGVLKVRHHFVRLWGLGNRTVVLDEIHAYDAYTSRLIEGLVRWLRALGSSVVLMSATLTHKQREGLAAAWGAELPGAETPYPRVTIVSDSARSLAVPWPEKKAYEIESAPRPTDELHAEIIEKLGEEGVAAAIVNTVDRAQRLYRKVQESLGSGEPILEEGVVVGRRFGTLEIYLLHARYPSHERQVREIALLSRFGKEGRRPRRALVIATQVAEQSLDLDFDLLFTDLAPLDLVLQRAGRVHRHKRSRSAVHAAPRIYVAGLGEDPPDIRSEYWDRVYAAYPLYMSWHLLRSRKQILLPDDMDTLIEAAYGDGGVEALPESVRAQAAAALEQQKRDLEEHELQASQVVVDPLFRLLERLGDDHSTARLGLDDEEENPYTQRPLTRLGEPSVQVIPLYSHKGNYYLDREFTHRVSLKGQITAEAARAVYAASLRVGRKGVTEKLRRENVPGGWKKNGLLRNLRPLILDERGTTKIGDTELRMDPELGLVYIRH